ncbi:MAG: hypothetical protein ACREOP_04945 [Thermodesulfobacteriota bacterium]
MSNLWDEDEFEDHLTKALVMFYEQKYGLGTEKACYPYKVSRQELQFVKDKGVYFPPGDRVVSIDEVHIAVDGLPAYGSLCDITRWKAEEMESGAQKYLSVDAVRKVPRLDPHWKCSYIAGGTCYVHYHFSALEQGGIAMIKDYFLIGKNGELRPTIKMVPSNSERGPLLRPAVRDRDSHSLDVRGVCAINAWADMKYLWNVEALDDNGKAIFGVYSEQVKSLLYARTLPVTETGRKRPILHWVSAHKRRLRNGTEVDISEFLRGTEEFSMYGTKFQISNPTKAGTTKRGDLL